MAYKKITLKEPIYELQEKETPRQHYFFDLYTTTTNDSLTKFIKSFEGLKKGDNWEYDNCTKTLEFNPPKPRTLELWASCLQYKNRRKAYWSDLFDAKRAERKKKIIDFMDSFLDDVVESTVELKITENEINYDTSRPHLKAQGKNNISSARKTNWEILKDLGDIEDPTQKHKIESENKIEYEGINNLLETFYDSRDEWFKHKKK